MDMLLKSQVSRYGNLKQRSVMGELRAIRDCLSGLKRKMHSFERVWSSSRSRFKDCAIVPEH